MYLNKVFLIGNLTKDPELKALPSGVKVCNMGLATNRFSKDKDGNRQEVVEYHNITAFARLGELCNQYLKKGRQIYVEGRLQTRSWDGQDGQKRYRTEVIADNIQFGQFPTRNDGSGQTSSSASKEEIPVTDTGEKIDYPQEEINPDDIPF